MITQFPNDKNAEAYPIPENGYVWSPITKRWYDINGQPIL